MARKSVYNVRIVTAMSMADLVTHLQPVGHVDKIETADGNARVSSRAANHSAAALRRDAKHPDLVKERMKNLERALEAFQQRVQEVLQPIMRANQFATLDLLTRLMNETTVKNYKGKPWTKETLQKHVDRAIEELTTPEV